MIKIKNCNWPELSSYCGCCKLSTGIYVRCGISVMLLSGLSVLVTNNIVRLLRLSREFHSSANQTVLVGYLNINVSPANYESSIIFFKTVIFFHIFWLAFRVMYISKTLYLCYAVYKSKVTAVKFLLYISIPCCIFDVLLSILGFFLFRHVLKIIVLLIFYLSEGYDLLVIYSEYKRISGTSRIICKEDIGEPNIDHNCQRSVTVPSNYFPYQIPHCQSCTCYILENSTTTENVATPINAPRYEDTFGNVSEINLPNDRIPRNTEIADENINTCSHNETLAAERPNFLNLDAEKKADIADTPIIYDEEQLQTSASPILDNR